MTTKTVDVNRVINMLKDQRYQIDDTLQSLAAERFEKDLFDAETVNDMIRARFDDVLSAICKGDIETATKFCEESMKTKWL